MTKQDIADLGKLIEGAKSVHLFLQDGRRVMLDRDLQLVIALLLEAAAVDEELV